MKAQQKPPKSRRERALETRRRMLGAAYALFRSRGYVGTTMDAIAAEAGVAVQTLYFTFRTKARLLEETVGASVAGFETWVPPAGGMGASFEVSDVEVLRRFHAWWAPFETARTARDALAVFVDAGVEIMERTAPLLSALRESSSEAEGKALYAISEERRIGAYHAVAKVLARRVGGLRPGLTVRRASDLLYAVFSGEVYQMLRDRGWKPREIRAWLVETLGEQLLGAPPDRTP